jgi:hypothetical protein
MTPIFVLSLVTAIAISGLLLIVLIRHIRRYDKAVKSELEKDGSVTESIIDSEAGFDWKRAA